VITNGFEDTKEKTESFFWLVALMIEYMLYQTEYLVRVDKNVFDPNFLMKDKVSAFYGFSD